MNKRTIFYTLQKKYKDHPTQIRIDNFNKKEPSFEDIIKIQEEYRGIITNWYTVEHKRDR